MAPYQTLWQTMNVAPAPKQTLAESRTAKKNQIADSRTKFNTNMAGTNTVGAVAKWAVPIVPPVVPPTPAPVVPAPVVPPANNLWNISDTNVHAAWLETTIGAAWQASIDAANKAAVIQNQLAADQAAIINPNIALDQANLDAQAKLLAWVGDTATANAAKFNTELEQNVLDQKKVAGRAANAAAAAAGESGLQMSAGFSQDVVNDITAKYGQNIANANQFKTTTGMSIADALKSTKLDIFQKQSTIDALEKVLRKEGAEPILNALKAAADGKVGAINDVKALITEFVKKKAGEEYTRTMASESRVAKDKEWQSADTSAKKKSILVAYNPSVAPYQDVAERAMINHPTWTQDEILWQVAKEIMWDENAKAGYQVYLTAKQQGWKDFVPEDIWEKYGQQIATAGTKTQEGIAKTDKQLETMNTQANASVAEQGSNPLNLTSKANLDFYKNQLGPQDKVAFKNEFINATKNLSPEKLKLNRGRIFDALKKKYSNIA